MQSDDDQSESSTSVVTVLPDLTISNMAQPTAFVEYDVHLAAMSVLLPAQARLVISINVPFPSNPSIVGMYACCCVAATKWRRSLQMQSNISGGVSQTLLPIVALRSNLGKQGVAFGSPILVDLG
jgi:hypothetical protein